MGGGEGNERIVGVGGGGEMREVGVGGGGGK